MDELRQAAIGRIDAVRRKVIDLKRSEGMSNQQLADFFELEPSTVRNFITGRQPDGVNLAIYITALGVEL